MTTHRAGYPGDPGIDSLVTELLALSPRFAGMWAEHEVEVRGPMLKHVDHPVAGPLEFECQVLHIAETGQRLIAYCAAPGSATEAAFAELDGRAPAGTYDAAGVLLKCGTARRVAPSGERTTRMPEDNEHGL